MARSTLSPWATHGGSAQQDSDPPFATAQISASSSPPRKGDDERQENADADARNAQMHADPQMQTDAESSPQIASAMESG